MDWTGSLIGAAMALGACVFFGWRGSRPPDFARGPRMIPHQMLMLLSAAALLVMIVHLINLAGINTGRQAGNP